MASLQDRNKLEAMFVLFSVVFDMKLKQSAIQYPEVATVVPGVSERVEFKWLSESPTMKRWVGDRQFARIRGESHVLRTEWWSNGLEVDWDDANSNAGGMISVRIGRLAAMAARRLDSEVFDYLNNGFTAARGFTYDGQFAFDVDHTSAGNGTGLAQTNLQTGALNSVNYNAALEKMLNFTDGEGEPLEENMIKQLIVGVANQLPARTLLAAQYGAGGATNIDVGMSKWIVNQRVTGTKWFVQNTADIRAVIIGIEIDPEFAAIEGANELPGFMGRKNLYGAHTKFGLCYGFWQNMVGCLG
jgi:phage major head subunit gpT-like protein